VGLKDFLGLGTDPLHDGGVVLSLLVLAGGVVALLLRIRAAAMGAPALGLLQTHRMIAVLGALGGLVAYLRELSLSHGLQDLTMGGVAALVWMGIVVLETLRKPGVH
jgi:hypothetical protein